MQIEKSHSRSVPLSRESGATFVIAAEYTVLALLSPQVFGPAGASVHGRGVHLEMIAAEPERLMRAALAQARRALEAGEVPVGAVVALGEEIIGAGFNQPIGASDPTAHAEIVAIREAARAIGNYRLTGAVLYVTVEPCLMCVGAAVHARLQTIVYGAQEPKAGALVSTIRAHEHPALNHRVEVVGGVLEDECRDLIQEFFRLRRGPSGRQPTGEVPKWS